MTGRAILSPDGVYRYTLERLWECAIGEEEARVLFVMLNPSTADAMEDDPTIRRCVGYAKRWGYNALGVVNLFAFRTTDPALLYAQQGPEAIGPDNDGWIVRAAETADLVIAAWGTHGAHLDRGEQVIRLLAGHRVYALGVSQDGHPRHPLYMPKAIDPKPYRGLPRVRLAR